MLKKKIIAIIGVAIITTFSLNGIGNIEGLIEPIEVQAVTLTGKQTPTGYITSKIKLEDTFPENEEELTVENLKKISIEVNPNDNPKMFSMPIHQYIIAPHLNFLTDNIYYYGRMATYSNGDKQWEDDFVKILGLEIGDKKNEVKVTFLNPNKDITAII